MCLTLGSFLNQKQQKNDLGGPTENTFSHHISSCDGRKFQFLDCLRGPNTLQKVRTIPTEVRTIPTEVRTSIFFAASRPTRGKRFGNLINTHKSNTIKKKTVNDFNSSSRQHNAIQLCISTFLLRGHFANGASDSHYCALTLLLYYY